MGDTALPVQKVLKGGAAAVRTGGLTVTPNTHSFRNSGRVILNFMKSAAVDCDVIIQTPMKVAGLEVSENPFTVPASTGDIVAGPFPPAIFNNGNGDVLLTLSDVDGLTVAVLEY